MLFPAASRLLIAPVCECHVPFDQKFPYREPRKINAARHLSQDIFHRKIVRKEADNAIAPGSCTPDRHYLGVAFQHPRWIKTRFNCCLLRCKFHNRMRSSAGRHDAECKYLKRIKSWLLTSCHNSSRKLSAQHFRSPHRVLTYTLWTFCTGRKCAWTWSKVSVPVHA